MCFRRVFRQIAEQQIIDRWIAEKQIVFVLGIGFYGVYKRFGSAVKRRFQAFKNAALTLLIVEGSPFSVHQRFREPTALLLFCGRSKIDVNGNMLCVGKIRAAQILVALNIRNDSIFEFFPL